MPNRYGPREAFVRMGNHPVEFLSEALRPIKGEEIRYTSWILFILLGVFVVEVVLMYQSGAESTYQLVSYFFKYYPAVVWPVAPFLHRGIGHFAGNLLVVYLAAPVETRMTKREFGILVLLAGYVAIFADGVKLFLFGSEPHVAVYGASGLGFGLLGYALAQQLGSIWEHTPRWWVIYVASFTAVGMIVTNLLAAVSNPIAIKLGHLGGFTVGFLLGHRANTSVG